MAKTTVLEFLVLQRHHTEACPAPLTFNESITTGVAGVGQPVIDNTREGYVWNETFFAVQKSNKSQVTNIREYLYGAHTDTGNLERIISTPPPIGVRCQVSSALGTAELNSARSSFSSFKETPDPRFHKLIMKRGYGDWAKLPKTPCSVGTATSSNP